MKFGVFDNNKPASTAGFPQLKGQGWDNHEFDTFDEAAEYAREWLGPYAVDLELNKPFNYDGYGDMIEIRKIDG